MSKKEVDRIARDWFAYSAGMARAHHVAHAKSVGPDCAACSDDQFWKDLGYSDAERRNYCHTIECPGFDA